MNPLISALLEKFMSGLPSEADVVNARARRSANGAPDLRDVLLDRFGTGQEMGLMGPPVAAVYEASKPILAASPTLNQILGKVLGPEQMVDETTQIPTFRESLNNVGATTVGALSRLLKRKAQ